MSWCLPRFAILVNRCFSGKAQKPGVKWQKLLLNLLKDMR